MQAWKRLTAPSSHFLSSFLRWEDICWSKVWNNDEEHGWVPVGAGDFTPGDSCPWIMLEIPWYQYDAASVVCLRNEVAAPCPAAMTIRRYISPGSNVYRQKRAWMSHKYNSSVHLCQMVDPTPGTRAKCHTDETKLQATSRWVNRIFAASKQLINRNKTLWRRWKISKEQYKQIKPTEGPISMIYGIPEIHRPEVLLRLMDSKHKLSAARVRFPSSRPYLPWGQNGSRISAKYLEQIKDPKPEANKIRVLFKVT